MHRSFLEMAIELARENVLTGNGGPFGAVITHNNQLIATGVNQVTSLNDPTAHAEIIAIRGACTQLQSFQLSGCILYSSCEPCPMCLGALYWARPSAVYFASSRHDAAAAGFDDAFIYTELLQPYQSRTIPTEQITIACAHAPFTAWQQTQHKKEY